MPPTTSRLLLESTSLTTRRGDQLSPKCTLCNCQVPPSTLTAPLSNYSTPTLPPPSKPIEHDDNLSSPPPCTNHPIICKSLCLAPLTTSETSISLTSIIYALISIRIPPNLKTSHCRLGHSNNQTIYDLATKILPKVCLSTSPLHLPLVNTGFL